MKNSTAAFIAVVAVAAFAAFYALSGMLQPAQGRYDNLTQCLARSGALMYGSETCHACAYQKQLLGPSFRFVSHIDCPSNPQLCAAQGISATPTWLINGSFIVGVQTPEQLAAASGCGL